MVKKGDKEMKKEEALKRMVKMKIFKEAKKNFENNGDVAIFENQGTPFLATYYSLNTNLGMEEYKVLKEKIEWFQKKFNCLVYMVQKSYTLLGELYSFFYVSDNQNDWQFDLEDIEMGMAYCYVWNKTHEEFSEFGSIAFGKAMGGVYRIG